MRNNNKLKEKPKTIPVYTLTGRTKTGALSLKQIHKTNTMRTGTNLNKNQNHARNTNKPMQKETNIPV